jgi:hypothetical protein
VNAPTPPARQKLTHYRAQLEREHLGQADLADGFGGWREATVEIAEVPILFRPRKPKRGEKQNKYLFRFVGKRKTWLSGPATQEVIAAMHGPFLERWVGKRITLYVDESIMFGKNKVGGIRVRPMIPRGPVTEDPLDEPIDEAGAAAREAAAEETLGDERQPGED